MTHASDAVDVAALSEAPVLDLQGRAVPLSSLWRDRTVVLSFVRHFG
jgi:hypothetical protein